MSHTGTVLRPNQSPGLIRIITVGYAISKVGSSADWAEKCDRVFENLQENKEKEIAKMKRICFRLGREKIEEKYKNDKKIKEELKQLEELFGATGSATVEDIKRFLKEEAKKRDFKKNELIFATPLKTRDAEEAVRERFVVFIPSGKADFQYGDAVKFNLLNCEEWKGQIAEEELEKLKLSLPTHWKKELGWIKKEDKDDCTNIKDIKNKYKFDSFNFKYLATIVERLPENFVLHPLYKFIEDLSEDTREDVLLKLAEIPHYRFKTIFQVECNNGSHSILGINLMDSSEFARLRLSDPEMCFAQAYKDEEDVQEEIADIGQHLISSAEELPTRKD